MGTHLNHSFINALQCHNKSLPTIRTYLLSIHIGCLAKITYMWNLYSYGAWSKKKTNNWGWHCQPPSDNYRGLGFLKRRVNGDTRRRGSWLNWQVKAWIDQTCWCASSASKGRGTKKNDYYNIRVHASMTLLDFCASNWLLKSYTRVVLIHSIHVQTFLLLCVLSTHVWSW